MSYLDTLALEKAYDAATPEDKPALAKAVLDAIVTDSTGYGLAGLRDWAIRAQGVWPQPLDLISAYDHAAPEHRPTIARALTIALETSPEFDITPDGDDHDLYNDWMRVAIITGTIADAGITVSDPDNILG